MNQYWEKMDNPCSMMDEKDGSGPKRTSQNYGAIHKNFIYGQRGWAGRGGHGFPMASMRLALTLIGIFIPRNLTTLTALTCALNAANHIVDVKKNMAAPYDFFFIYYFLY